MKRDEIDGWPDVVGKALRRVRAAAPLKLEAKTASRRPRKTLRRVRAAAPLKLAIESLQGKRIGLSVAFARRPH